MSRDILIPRSTQTHADDTKPSRRIHRPSGAYKLLIALYDASIYPTIEVDERGGVKGSLLIPSIRRLATLLGTKSTRINAWLAFLEAQGYLTSLSYSSDRRSCRVRLRRPRNI